MKDTKPLQSNDQVEQEIKTANSEHFEDCHNKRGIIKLENITRSGKIPNASVFNVVLLVFVYTSKNKLKRMNCLYKYIYAYAHMFMCTRVYIYTYVYT